MKLQNRRSRLPGGGKSNLSRGLFYWIIVLLFLALPLPGRGMASALVGVSNVNDAAAAQPARSPEIPTNQILLKYRAPAQMNNLAGPALAAQMQRLDQAAGAKLTLLRQTSGEAQVLRLANRLHPDQMQALLQRLQTLPEVEYAEPDAILRPMLVPNDPQYPNQWSLLSPAAGHYGINAPLAWNITTGSASVVIGVIDTGITNHADLAGRTVPGYDFITYIQFANDGDARDANPSDPGDWITSAESTVDPFIGCPVSNSSWHGTHTSGTIGATGNNSLGVTGINWKSKILPVRVLGKCGGYTSDIIDGMLWAAGLPVSGVPDNANPAKVINLSLGGTGPCATAMQTAIDSILAAGTSVVVSAGNSDTDASTFEPASCNGVIAVAATDRNGSRAYYSNYGAVVKISAPGGTQSFSTDPNGILSTLNTGLQGPVADSYGYYQGTSMSAPHVSGVISLLYSVDPALTPAQILQILQSTSTQFPAGSTCSVSTCGSGIVNAGLAVYKAAGIPIPPLNQNPELYLPLIRR
jgi:serine protease